MKETGDLKNANIIYKKKIEGCFGIVEKLIELIDFINIATENISNENYTKDEINSAANNVDSEAEELFNYALSHGY